MPLPFSSSALIDIGNDNSALIIYFPMASLAAPYRTFQGQAAHDSLRESQASFVLHSLC